MSAVPVPKLSRVLVANRGEIAVRIIRACRELGIETVQAYSQADADSLAVRLADQAICIGRARSADSYLNGNRLLSAALVTGADAIHPGYGFLSENSAFALSCEENGLRFIGPSSEVIRNMGDKAVARRLAKEAGVPITPGSDGVLPDEASAIDEARLLGYPVLLKARAGGGGRGMRVVADEASLGAAYREASREAVVAFGDGALYIEKYLTRIRHIEVQVLGDGNDVIHLGERDCSIQRRNQKLIEETPSPALDEAIRAQLCEAAVKLSRHVRYRSAGTIEFIFDEASRSFYFMEMNTRIQVEHPVTEMVTGIDLVKAQLRIAAGESLPVSQDQVRARGHAIECRINAEDPDKGFAPSPGVIQRFHSPGGPGVRIDSHAFTGYAIPPYYDSLVAKLICVGADREEALARMQRALAELKLDGIKTTAPFHQRMLQDAGFRSGQVHTQYVHERFMI